MDAKFASAGISAKIISMCVVPVNKIGHAGTKMEVSTLSMLDNCSQGTFVKENIKKKLGIKWQEDWDCNKNIQWKAKYGVHLGNWVTRFPKMLMVKVPEGWTSRRYTREDLQADIEELVEEEPIQEKARKWEHLKIIADKLPKETNTEIGLLIGANCLKALEPEEVLPTKDGGPFAFRTPLGWCVVELLTKLGRESSVSCNWIVVKDPLTRKTAFHHFGMSSKVKDINAKQMNWDSRHLSDVMSESEL